MHLHQNSPPRRQRTYREGTWLIPDPESFASWVDQVIREHHGGSTNRAAGFVRAAIDAHGREEGDVGFASMSQAQLSRLRRAKLGGIPEQNVWGLLFLAPDEQALEVLQHLLVTPETRRGLEDETTRFNHRALARSPTRDELLLAMRARSRGKFGAFDTFVRRMGHDRETIELALDRVVEPFAVAAETSRVDRLWNELTGTEQDAYLKLALDREMILLDREPDLQRLQAGASNNRFLVALRSTGKRVRVLRGSVGPGRRTHVAAP